MEITDLYDTNGRLMYSNGKERDIAGNDAAMKAAKLNGTENDFSAEKEAGRDEKDREAGDVGELVAVRWLRDTMPEAHIEAPCGEEGENADVDVTVNGYNVDIKARDLQRDPPATDLLVGANRIERKDYIDFYLSVAVSRDRQEIVIQGGQSRDFVADCQVATWMPNNVRLCERPDLLNPNRLIDKLSQ